MHALVMQDPSPPGLLPASPAAAYPARPVACRFAEWLPGLKPAHQQALPPNPAGALWHGHTTSGQNPQATFPGDGPRRNPPMDCPAVRAPATFPGDGPRRNPLVDAPAAAHRDVLAPVPEGAVGRGHTPSGQSLPATFIADGSQRNPHVHDPAVRRRGRFPPQHLHLNRRGTGTAVGPMDGHGPSENGGKAALPHPQGADLAGPNQPAQVPTQPTDGRTPERVGEMAPLQQQSACLADPCEPAQVPTQADDGPAQDPPRRRASGRQRGRARAGTTVCPADTHAAPEHGGNGAAPPHQAPPTAEASAPMQALGVHAQDPPQSGASGAPQQQQAPPTACAGGLVQASGVNARDTPQVTSVASVRAGGATEESVILRDAPQAPTVGAASEAGRKKGCVAQGDGVTDSSVPVPVQASGVRARSALRVLSAADSGAGGAQEECVAQSEGSAGLGTVASSLGRQIMGCENSDKLHGPPPTSDTPSDISTTPVRPFLPSLPVVLLM
jgi:hypothetical protein